MIFQPIRQQLRNQGECMKTKNVIAVSIILLGVVAFSLFVSLGTAQAVAGQDFAVERTPVPWRETVAPIRATLSALPTLDGTALENLLIREKLAMNNQQTRLTLAHTVAENTQTFIDNQNSSGKDTSSLESALSAFTQAISQSEANNAAAASLLANPAGFDASGQVVDRDTALDTLRSAGQYLRQAHLTLTQATLNLRMALQTYRD
jgi:hypothetical protein